MCVRALLCVCARAFVRAFVRVCVCVRVRVCNVVVGANPNIKFMSLVVLLMTMGVAVR